MQKFLIIAVFLLAGSHQIQSAQFWDDLRITFGTNPVDFFSKIPRSLRDPLFVQQGWTQVTQGCNNSAFHGVQYVVPGEYSAALLFDVNGVVAGIQQLLNKTSLLVPGNNVNYPTLPIYQTVTYGTTEYFVVTSYFVDPTTICSTGRNDSSLETDGTGTGLWIQNGTSPSSAIEVPMTRAAAIEQGWTKNQCFAAMGRHNFYQVELYESHNCTQIFPVFGLYSNTDELLGFGFIHPGTVLTRRFENPPNPVIQIILGDAPQCVLDVNDRIGLTSMHVYFVDSPWLIAC